MLTLYRRALHLRRTEFPPATPMTWLPAPAGVLAFTRGSLTCITNLSPAPIPLPPGAPILTSTPLALPDSSHLPPDTTIWLRLPAAP
jgi:alpha-glucosidase